MRKERPSAGRALEAKRAATGHKRAEEARGQLTREWQATFDAIEDLVAVIDKAHRVVRANRAMHEAFGGMTVLGAHCYELFHGTKEPVATCPVSQTFRTGQPTRCELCEQHLGGRWFDISAWPVTGDDGTGQQVVHVIRDVTERKRAEEERRRAAERLETVNRELERSNRDFEGFTQTVAHDLQEPLRKILTFGEFLAEDLGERLPESARHHLVRMQEAAVRMQGLIRHLLELARVGTQGRKPTEVAPALVVGKVLETLSERVKESGAEIVVAADLPRVMADPVQLEQVLQNLLGNALKFRSPQRTPRITVSATEEGEQVRFTVSDNGIGIEERFFERIFGMFQRLYPREQYEGAGVGLALCGKIVRRHGGRIWVESDVGKGSRFYFTLPAFRPADGGNR
jgi:PAS domain S-box-containing protein